MPKTRDGTTRAFEGGYCTEQVVLATGRHSLTKQTCHRPYSWRRGPRDPTGAELTHSLRGTLERPRSRLREHLCPRRLSRVGRKSSASGRHCDALGSRRRRQSARIAVSVNNRTTIKGSFPQKPRDRGSIVPDCETINLQSEGSRTGRTCPILAIAAMETVCLSGNSLKILLFVAATGSESVRIKVIPPVPCPTLLTKFSAQVSDAAEHLPIRSS